MVYNRRFKYDSITCQITPDKSKSNEIFLPQDVVFLISFPRDFNPFYYLWSLLSLVASYTMFYSTVHTLV